MWVWLPVDDRPRWRSGVMDDAEKRTVSGALHAVVQAVLEREV